MQESERIFYAEDFSLGLFFSILFSQTKVKLYLLDSVDYFDYYKNRINFFEKLTIQFFKKKVFIERVPFYKEQGLVKNETEVEAAASKIDVLADELCLTKVQEGKVVDYIKQHCPKAAAC